MAGRSPKRILEQTPSRHPLLADAHKLRNAVLELDWGCKPPEGDPRREVRALQRAMDAFTQSTVAWRRAGTAATPQHQKRSLAALKRLVVARANLDAFVGERVGWVFNALHTGARASWAT